MNWGEVISVLVGSSPGLIAVLTMMFRMDRKLAMLLVEHEMLMSEYARGKGIQLKDLPTRSRQ